MGCKVLYFSVSLLLCLMICEHVRAQCTPPSFETRNVFLSGYFLLTESFPDGSDVTFECMIGYKPVDSRASKLVTCRGDQWTSLELTCTKKSCGNPGEFHNGKYEGTGILFGDRMTAVCNEGYILAGQIKDRWCRDKGWDGRDPVCEEVKCEPPPTIENGQLAEVPLDIYDYSHAVSYKCNTGFEIVGSSTLHCSEDGTFKPNPPKCVDGCSTPYIPYAIRIGGKSPPYKLRNFVDYECKEGYTMKGEYHIVCSAEGWKPEPPKCIGPCSKPVFEGHVILTAEYSSKTIFPFGSKVTVECVNGYEAVDSTVSKSVTCEETEWTKPLLTCKVVKCEVPPTIENGQLEDPQESYDYSQVVSYKCNSEFTLTGSPKLHCSEDGTFKPEPPKCLATSTPTATTATTSTKVTSKIQPKDENPKKLNSTAVTCIVLAVVAVGGALICLGVAFKKRCCVPCIWCFGSRSKREHSEKMKTKNESEALHTLTHTEVTP